MMTFEQAMKMVQDKMKEVNPEINTQEGSICYDLISPFAYVLQGFQQYLEEFVEDYSLQNATLETLEHMATDRIGNHREATATVIRIQTNMVGKDLTSETWYPENYKDVLFHPLEGEEGETIKIQSDLVGHLNLLFSTGMMFQSTSGEEATLVEILSYGSNEETIEQYRERYLSSFLIDKQAGTGPYYKEILEQHPLIGYAYINYSRSTVSSIQIIVTNADYGQIDDASIQKVLEDIDSKIPIGQHLQLISLEEVSIPIDIIFENFEDSDEEYRKNIETFIQRLFQEVYLFRMFSSMNLQYMINYIDFASQIISNFSEDGFIRDVLIDNNRLNYLLDHLIPKIQIQFS